MAELLVWPALIAYGEAAFAYAGELRGPGLAGRAATWGVRIGWLAQTALLVVQLLDADGFPWGTWAGALNLFVWLVVGAYLIWGCKPRYRLLGLAVMPLALVLLVAAWAGGGTGIEHGDRAGVLLGFHVGLMLAGFAALTLATGMAALYVLGGAPAQAPRSLRAAGPRAAARHSRPALGPGRPGGAGAPRGRDRRRPRQLRVGATSTRRWPSRSLSGRCTPSCSSCGTSRGCSAGAPPG